MTKCLITLLIKKEEKMSKISDFIATVKNHKEKVDKISTSMNDPNIFFKIAEALKLDEPFVRALINALLAVIPITFQQLPLILPLVFGAVDSYKKKKDKIQMSDLNSIIKEIKDTVNELKSITQEEIVNLSEGNKEILESLKFLNENLRLLEEIQEVVNEFGFIDLHQEIEEKTSFEDEHVKADINNFKNFLVCHSYNPIIQNVDFSREDTQKVEDLIENDETVGVLLLGQIGSGKTTTLKRIAYDFMVKKGWNVYIKRKSDFDVQKMIEQLNKLDTESLLVIDDASDTDVGVLKDLVKQAGEQAYKKIKFVMAERKDKWIDKEGNYIIPEHYLRKYNSTFYELKLTEDDVRKYAQFRELSEEKAESLVEEAKKEILGKPGEFIILSIRLDSITKRESSEKALQDRIDAIDDSIEPDEKKIFWRVATIGEFSEKYAEDSLKKVLKEKDNISDTDFAQLKDSLRRKGHILSVDSYIETYHPYVCRMYIRTKVDTQLVYSFLEEYLLNENSSEMLTHMALEILRGSYLESLSDLKRTFYKNLRYLEIAVKFVKKAIEIDPNNAIAHFGFATLLQELKRYEEAEAEYRKVIEIEPNNAIAHFGFATFLKELKRYEEAEAEYRKAIEIDPNYEKAHRGLADLLKKLKRYEEAEAEYRKAIEIDPNNAIAHFGFATLLQELKRYEEAEAEYRKASKSD